MMKRILLLWKVGVISVLVSSGCSSGQDEKVDVYKMESFSDNTNELVASFTDSKETAHFKNAFKKAKRQPGIVDMAYPQYKVEFIAESYYLWIDEEHGTIMNMKDTHTIYSLSKSSIKRINELVNQ